MPIGGNATANAVINQNLSRIYKITYIFDFLNMNWYNIILATHTTSPAMLSYLAP